MSISKMLSRAHVSKYIVPKVSFQEMYIKLYNIYIYRCSPHEPKGSILEVKVKSKKIHMVISEMPVALPARYKQPLIVFLFSILQEIHIYISLPDLFSTSYPIYYRCTLE